MHYSQQAIAREYARRHNVTVPEATDMIRDIGDIVLEYMASNDSVTVRLFSGFLISCTTKPLAHVNRFAALLKPDQEEILATIAKLKLSPAFKNKIKAKYEEAHLIDNDQ